MSALDTSTVVGAGKYVNQPRHRPVCAHRVPPGHGCQARPDARQGANDCVPRGAGIAPTQTARYQPQTGEITAIDATTGESVTMDG